jgi:RNA polymerase sigma factor (TIGR02999 family)
MRSVEWPYSTLNAAAGVPNASAVCVRIFSEGVTRLAFESSPTPRRRGTLNAMGEVTRILDLVESGDANAAERLLPLIYDELRRLAAQKLAHEKPGQTLQATALVHEAFLRLVGGSGDSRWDGRRHFFAAAAEAMRRILVDRARRKKSGKHGGNLQRCDLDTEAVVAPEQNVDLVALDAALVRLAEHDPAKAKLVELRYFAGLTGNEAAEVLGISPSTADREWVYTRAWLRREIEKQT